MSNSEIIKLFNLINCARLGAGYAPHKPILILLLLDRILNGHANHFPFAELDHDLRRLLEKYGSNNASNTRNEPFWRLKNDGLWDIIAPAELLQQTNTPSPNQLVESNAAGEFKPEIYAALTGNPDLIAEIAKCWLPNLLIIQSEYLYWLKRLRTFI